MQHQVTPFRLLEIQRERTAPARHHIEFRALHGVWRRAASRLTIDADHFRPHVGEHHGGERTRPEPDHLDHANALERPTHRNVPRNELAFGDT